MLEDVRFDIFLAYFGDSRYGSEAAARKLYQYLIRQKNVDGTPLRVYFHPETNRYGQFGDTPIIVQRTPMFLLVANKNIPRNDFGQIPEKREDGSRRELFEEIRAFYTSRIYKEVGSDANPGRVFISDDMNFMEAEWLHPMFSSKTSFTEYAEVLDWIYTIKRQRLVKKLQKMAVDDKSGFMRGEWVNEARCFWKRDHNEQIGRSLLVYYIQGAMNGNFAARQAAQNILDILSRCPMLENKTNILVNEARKALRNR